MEDVLRRIVDELAEKEETVTTPRELFSAFGMERRTCNACAVVDKFLEENKFETEPHYNETWIDSEVVIRNKKRAQLKTYKDPVKKIGVLKAANTRPVIINNDAELKKAISLMMLHDYSQLPVTKGGDRGLIGFVSWETIGRGLANGKQLGMVKDFVDQNVETLELDTPLLKAIRRVYDNDFVITVQNGAIKGIVTTADISDQFLQFSEPFLLLEEIENHIRILLNNKLLLEDIIKLCEAESRNIEHIEDLSFGDYVEVIQNPDCWQRLQLDSIDRTIIVERLDKTRLIRNEIMHFEPAGITEEQYGLLKKMCDFFENISKYHNLT